MLFLPLTGTEITVPVAEMVVNIISFILNGSFLIALYNKKRLNIPYNRGDIFVANIALVDLLVTTRFIWEWTFITGVANEAVCFMDAFWTIAFLGAEMCLVFGLSLERYLGVVKGLRADRRAVTVILVVSWVCGIFLDGLLSVLIGPYGPTPANTGCTLHWWDSRGVSAWISLQLLWIWLSMIFFYYRVWKVSSDVMNQVNTTREGERTLALRLFLIVFLFLTCWTPAMIAFSYCAITGNEEPGFLSALAGVFLAINTIVDPAVFLWINPDNRKALCALLTCASPAAKIRKITSRGSSQRTTRTSQTRELSPSRGEVAAPPSPSGPVGASELAPLSSAPLPQLPLLQLTLSSSDSAPLEDLSTPVAMAEVAQAAAPVTAETKTNNDGQDSSHGQDSPRADSEAESVPGTPSASSQEHDESNTRVDLGGQMEPASSEQASKKEVDVVVVSAE